MTRTNEPAPLRSAILKSAARLIIVLGIAFGAFFLMQWVQAQTKSLSPSTQDFVLRGVIALLILAYALLIAVPFVPGIEIGLSLMMIGGAPMAPAVYAATVAGLMLAYLAGRFMSYRWLRRVLLDLRLKRAAAFLERITWMPKDERLSTLRSRLPGRIGRFAINFRYISIGLLVNVPGNALIGGGGGICLIAGLSRLYSAWFMLLTLALAVAPVPALVWFFGINIFGN
ncbi:MAG: hypothetical protein ACC619_02270 [Paracoccaceae bacterium]